MMDSVTSTVFLYTSCERTCCYCVYMIIVVICSLAHWFLLTSSDFSFAGNVVSEKDATSSAYQRPFNRKDVDGKNIVLTGDRDRSSQLLNPKASQPSAQDGKPEQLRLCDTSQYSVQSTPFVEHVVPFNQISLIGSKEIEPLLALSHLRMDPASILSFIEGSQLVKKPNELSLGIEDLVIPWNDLVLREKIGAGICSHSGRTFCAFSSKSNF